MFRIAIAGAEGWGVFRGAKPEVGIQVLEDQEAIKSLNVNYYDMPNNIADYFT